MIKKLLVITFLFLCTGLNAQTTFQKTISGIGNAGGTSIVKTADGGYVVAGAAGVHPNTVGYVAKVDSSGNLQWSSSYVQDGYTSLRSITPTYDGGYIMTGRAGYMIFKALVIKINATGAIQWSKTFEFGSFDWGNSVIQTADSGFAIAGRSYTGMNYGSFILKLNSAGSIQWVSSSPGFEDGAYSIVQTPDQGYAIAGFSVSGNSDIIIARLSSTGTTLWSKTAGGPGSDMMYAGSNIILTSDGGFALSGFTNSYGSGSNDIYVLKFSGSGSLLWSKAIGSAADESGYCIIQTADHGYIVGGSTSVNGYDGIIAKLDSNGVYQWAKQIGGSGSDGLNSVASSSDGGFIMTGGTGGDILLAKFNASYGNCSANQVILNSSSGGTAVNATGAYGNTSAIVSTVFPVTNSGGYITTLCTCPAATATAGGNTTFCSGGSVTLFANSLANTTYQWNLNGNPINAAVNTSYTATTSGSYTVTETSQCGTTTSNPVTVTVNPLPSATTTPTGNVGFCSGGITLQANTGAGLAYQWKKNGGNIAGATGSSHVASTTGVFTVVVTSAAGCSKTSAQVNVSGPPTNTITASGPTYICSSGSVTLSSASNQPVTYAWKRNGAFITGATSPSLVVNTGGQYNCVVTNGYGCTKTGTAIKVTVGPPDATIIANGPVSFCAGGSVQLSAVNGYTYQWRKNGVNIAGAVQQTYTATTAGKYKVMVTDQWGCTKITPTSGQITVSIPCRTGEIYSEGMAGISVSPNPSDGKFDVQISFSEDVITSIEVFTLLGKLVETHSAESNVPLSIDLTSQPDGIYFIQAVINDKRLTQKIVKY